VPTYHASWASSYQDLGKLKQASDVVVNGTITKVARLTAGSEGIPFTDFTFNIKKVAWDRIFSEKGGG
jgi:hypothetical protein